MSETYVRQQLGDFNSTVCFKALVTGISETLGDKAAAIALVNAGRKRGKGLVTSLGLAGKADDLNVLATSLNEALGKTGTRLCLVDKIEADGDTLKVFTSETVCSANEPIGSSMDCTFTLGAIWGAVETALGKRYRGKQVESVLRGGKNDVFEFTLL
jgi:predicted hydrocarbon binding protein